MKLEIWSDIACPFCYIGKRNLDAALAEFEHADAVERTWRSFQLDPNAPRAVDRDMHEHLAVKKGVSRAQAQEMNARMTAMAQAAGLEYDLDAARPANTLDAHRLTHLAAAHGLGDAAQERLFAAQFVNGERIGDPAVLVAIGTEIGLDPEEVAAMLAGDAYAADVLADRREAAELGVNGVPFFVLDRRFAVSGAQPPGLLLAALRQAWEAAVVERAA